jgi:hypothetical protein
MKGVICGGVEGIWVFCKLEICVVLSPLYVWKQTKGELP